MAFETDIWLVVLPAEPPDDALRAHWNAKEEDKLTLVPAEDRLWLGQTRAITPDEPRSPGRAGRVVDLLTRAGTTPDYNAPRVTPELEQQIMAAFGSVDDTVPATDSGSLRRFLAAKRGWVVLFSG